MALGQNDSALPPYHSLYVLATHKTGSSFLSRTFSALSREGNKCFTQCTDKTCFWNLTSADTRRCSDGDVLFSRAPPRNSRDTTVLIKKLEGGDCRAIVAFRNPLDAVVSRFQSFTQNHAIKAGLTYEEREAELQIRQREHEKGVDRWALEHWPDVLGAHQKSLEALRELQKRGCEVMASQYEEMVSDPDSWVARLAQFLGISKETAETERQWTLLQRTAANEKSVKPNESTHTAYFYPGAYLKQLNASTISRLLASFERPPGFDGEWPWRPALESFSQEEH